MALSIQPADAAHGWFMATLAASIDAIVAVDAAQHIVTWNAAAERMFGVAAAEAVGQQLDRFVSFRVATVWTGTSAAPERRAARRHDGTWFTAEFAVAPVDAAHTLWIIRDCTAQVHLETALVRCMQGATTATALEHLLATSAGEIVALYTRTGVCVATNNVVGQMLGYADVAMIGKPLNLTRVHPADRPRHPWPACGERTMRVQHQDGAWHTLQVTVTDVNWCGVLHFIVTARDVTMEAAATAVAQASQERAAGTAR